MTLEQQFREDMEAIVKATAENINGLRTVAFNTVKSKMSRRVFQNGISTDGSPIGQYEESTKRTRERGGRQTARVDLEMTGELRRSFAVGTDGKAVVMGIISNTEPKISVKGGVVRVTGKTDYTTTQNAIDQEERFGKEIFAPSEEEVDESQEVFLFEYEKLIQKTLGKSKTIKVRIKGK